MEIRPASFSFIIFCMIAGFWRCSWNGDNNQLGVTLVDNPHSPPPQCSTQHYTLDTMPLSLTCTWQECEVLQCYSGSVGTIDYYSL